MHMPEWLSITETLTFICLLIGLIYNRLVSWKKFNERTAKLETSFEQYQKDMALFFKTCEICRAEVRGHHEALDRHVTPDLRSQISGMAEDIREIKNILIKV